MTKNISNQNQNIMKNDKNRPVPLHERESHLSEPRKGQDHPDRNPEDLDDELHNHNGAGVPPTKDMVDNNNNSTTVNDNI